MARFLWPVLLAGAVILAVVVSAAGEQTRTELEYLDEIRAQATELSRSGASIIDVMSRIREVDRDEFVEVFDAVAVDLDVALAFLADQPPTPSLIPVWALYRQSVEAWDSGVNGLAGSILQAADDPEDATVINVVADSLADLRAGDNLYRDLQIEVQRDEIPTPVSTLVDVRLTPSDGGLVSLGASYVAAARASTNGLGLRPGLTVSQIVSEPIWQISADDQPVVPATETITFSSVITNSGNVESATESVTMTLTGGPEPILAQVELPPLAPDGQTTVTFPPVEVDSETLYEVLVELVVTGLDSDLTDNSLRVQFTVNTS